MPSYADEVLADVPNTYHKMDEASGVIGDSSGNGLNSSGTNGTPTYRIVGPITSGSPNYGIQSDGATSFNFTDHALLDLGDGPFTLEGWVKRGASQGTLQTMMAKGGHWQVGFWSANTFFLAENGVAIIVESTITITDTTTWHHFVCTKTGATVKLYIDGVDRTGTVTDQTMVNNANAAYFAAVDGASEFLSSGHQVAQFAIYPSVLSAARVSAHFNAAASIAKVASFSDPLTHPTVINAALWDVVTSGTGFSATASTNGVVFASGAVEGWAEINSDANYDAVASRLFCELVSHGNQAGTLQAVCVLRQSSGNQVYFIVNSNMLYASKIVAGVSSDLASVAYNAATMKYVSIREAGGTTYWEYSADGVAWTLLHSVANPITMSSVKVIIGNYSNGTSSSVTWRNVNVQKQPTLHIVRSGLRW